MRSAKKSAKRKSPLQYERELRNWTQADLANELYNLALEENEEDVREINAKMVGGWERGEHLPSLFWRKKLCQLLGKNAAELGFVEVFDVPLISLSNTTLPLEEISQTALEQPLSPISIWYVPYPRNPFFTGREDLLGQLHTVLSKQLTVALSQAHALCGLGGIGKTQTVLEYIYRYRSEYHAVFWIKADTHESLISDFLTLADLLKLPEQNAQQHHITVNAVKRWLNEHKNWLLIFDNVDDLALLRNFIPLGHQGHILLTTRVQAMGRLAHRLEVDKMDEETGLLFLLRRAGYLFPETSIEDVFQGDREDARELVEELGGLPLAIDQAGAYLEETQCSIPAYLRLFKSKRSVLLSRRGGLIDDHPLPVSSTWDISFQKIAAISPPAADLLCLCSFLDPDAIPEELITESAAELGTNLAIIASNELALNQTIEVTWRYSLLRRNPKNKTLNMHRLVQAVLKDTLKKEDQRIWAERVVRAIHYVFPHQITIPIWGQCQRLLPHALLSSELCIHWQFCFPEAAHLLNQVAYYLRSVARYQEAESIYQQALALRIERYGNQHLDTAQSYYNLARLYFDVVDYPRSEQFYQQALTIREHLLGSEHQLVALCLNSLALLYWYWGKYEQSQCLYNRALPLFYKLFGKEHPNTAHCVNNYALLCLTQRKFTEAEQLHKQVLAVREMILPPNHPDTAQSLQNLAGVYIEQGRQEKYKEAEQLMLRSLVLREQVLGVNHPQTARSLHNLADLYVAQERLSEAEDAYKRALIIRQKTLGPKNPRTVATQEAYASLLKKMHQEEDIEQG